jgi:predicted RNA-binding Zn-ribbon protein involved in translation (DUF1610 family)
MFKRNKEDFICEHCGVEVVGNGYTNHCPQCLWSKHVDIDPGDRRADCGGAMEPVWIEIERNEHVITHACKKCAHKRRQRLSSGDNQQAVLDLAKQCARTAHI